MLKPSLELPPSMTPALAQLLSGDTGGYMKFKPVRVLGMEGLGYEGYVYDRSIPRLRWWASTAIDLAERGFVTIVGAPAYVNFFRRHVLQYVVIAAGFDVFLYLYDAPVWLLWIPAIAAIVGPGVRAFDGPLSRYRTDYVLTRTSKPLDGTLKEYEKNLLASFDASLNTYDVRYRGYGDGNSYGFVYAWLSGKLTRAHRELWAYARTIGVYTADNQLTPEGEQMRGKVLALKEYLQNPSEPPSASEFHRLIPYAVAFDVAPQWMNAAGNPSFPWYARKGKAS